ncbi:hypothetical protein TNCV_3905421 [Trichonephila clavipes]|nr:hypothetical protein TNCV_3905421 [Trichonephila clavipes]
MQMTFILTQFHLSFEREHPGVGQRPSTSANLTRGTADRRLFRVPPCRHLQTSMPSLGSELRPYSTVISVTNHYTGWETIYLCCCYQCHLIGKGQIEAHEIHHGKGLSDASR